MAVIVQNPGPLTTVQDLGRYDYQDAGMPVSGVMDQRAYQEANWLLNHTDGEAVLEFTMFGGVYQFTEETVIALTGGDMEPVLDGRSIPMYRPVQVPAGGCLSLGMAKHGCRTYQAVAGGFQVPVVMGSRSTNLKSSIGGFQGRALQSGDLLETGTSIPGKEYQELASRTLPSPVFSGEVTLRTISGPQEHFFTEAGIRTFYSEPYTVSVQSDRMGCRLDGPAVESRNGTDILSDGIVFGSVQVTSAGQPIILMADRQTTGGYAKIATVCTADLPLLAQCRPGDTVRFSRISLEEAARIWKEELHS